VVDESRNKENEKVYGTGGKQGIDSKDDMSDEADFFSAKQRKSKTAKNNSLKN
jgi:hypothetical protein